MAEVDNRSISLYSISDIVDQQVNNTPGVAKYVEIIKKLAEAIFDPKIQRNITFFEIATLTMSVVEELMKNNVKLTSEEKKELAVELLPTAVDVLVDLNKLSKIRGEEIKEEMIEHELLIRSFIDAAAFIANNPHIINAGKWVIEESKSALKKCTNNRCLVM